MRYGQLEVNAKTNAFSLLINWKWAEYRISRAYPCIKLTSIVLHMSVGSVKWQHCLQDVCITGRVAYGVSLPYDVKVLLAPFMCLPNAREVSRKLATRCAHTVHSWMVCEWVRVWVNEHITTQLGLRRSLWAIARCIFSGIFTCRRTYAWKAFRWSL